MSKSQSPIRVPKEGKILRLTPTLWHFIGLHAACSGLTVTAWVEAALERAVLTTPMPAGPGTPAIAVVVSDEEA